MHTPLYWDKAVAFLSRDDAVMAKLSRCYPERLQRRGDAFQTLGRAIVGQQISIQAAASIWGRLEGKMGRVTPDRVLALKEGELRQAGLSRPKIRYLGGLARYWRGHGITDAHWQGRSLNDVRVELLRLAGIGPWTVEMFAIFHLHEPDVFSPADVGLQKAVAALYFDGGSLDQRRLEVFSARWRPFRTVAAWYLWRHLDPEPVCY